MYPCFLLPSQLYHIHITIITRTEILSNLKHNFAEIYQYFLHLFREISFHFIFWISGMGVCFQMFKRQPECSSIFLETFSYEKLRRAKIQIRSCNYICVPHNCARVNSNIIVSYLIIINIWNLSTLFNAFLYQAFNIF